ncbi:MAG: lipid II flippase MurJ, partial [Candidatus Omnitrophota bacterium]
MATGAYGSGAKKFHFEFTLKIGAVVFFFVVAAKLLNFLKKIMVGSLFGISWEADSFFAATYLPYYAAVFFEGVIYLGFIPRFSRILAEEGEKAAKFFAGGMLAWLILLSGMLAVGFCLGAPWVIRGIVPGFKVHSIALTQELFGIVNFVILFITLSSFFQSLNSFFGQPLKAASSGLTDSLAMITVTFLTYRWLGIYGAAWGAVTGAFLAFCLQAFFLRQRYRFLGLGLRLRLRPLAELVKILLPLGMIWVFQMVPLVILNRFGSGMWQGTITSLTIALGIMVVPTGLVSQTILISVFPSLAKQASEATPENVRSTFFGTLRATFFVLIPAGFLLSGFSGPMAALFFGGQSGASEGTIRIANALACLGWSAFAF